MGKVLSIWNYEKAPELNVTTEDIALLCKGVFAYGFFLSFFFRERGDIGAEGEREP